MPCKESKARKLLKIKRAVIVKRVPFTIKLVYGAYGRKENIVLGVDTGSQYIGLSATTKRKVLFEAEVEQRNDVTGLMSSRKALRHTRRNRKLRYRKTRYNNRSIVQGWLPPSIQQKILTHLSAIKAVFDILPVSKIIIEIAKFDIYRLQNPEAHGIDYQNGVQKGFGNVREYILWRDNHTCQSCQGASGDKILNIHHIQSRKVGGNSPQ